jgi:hypothetical protein
MNFFVFRFFTLALVFLMAEKSQARRHHFTPRSEELNTTPTQPEDSNTTLVARQYGGGALRMGQSGFVNLATSYIIEDSSSNAGSANTPASNFLGGACGWAGMPNPGHQVWGAAIQTKFFMKGVACGMCVEINQAGATQPARQGGHTSSESEHSNDHTRDVC